MSTATIANNGAGLHYRRAAIMATVITLSTNAAKTIQKIRSRFVSLRVNNSDGSGKSKTQIPMRILTHTGDLF